MRGGVQREVSKIVVELTRGFCGRGRPRSIKPLSSSATQAPVSYAEFGVLHADFPGDLALNWVRRN